jgi:hypothetical protein
VEQELLRDDGVEQRRLCCSDSAEETEEMHQATSLDSVLMNNYHGIDH